MDFIAFDVETANSKNDSICSLGLTFVKDSKIVFSKNILINPETPFSDIASSIHGITAADVADAPCFPAAWEQYKAMFAHYPAVAHNAPFDKSVLEKTAKRYGIELPAILYYDTMLLAKENLALDAYSLPAVAAHFGVELDCHHNAAADSCCAACIMCKMMQDENLIIYPLDFEQPKSRNGNSTRQANVPSKTDMPRVQPVLDYWHGEIEFEGKTYVFTGDIPGLERSDASAFVVELGGKVTSSVSRKTDYLVVGMEDASKTSIASGKSTKIIKAETLNQQGNNIKIVTGDSFFAAIRKQINHLGMRG